MSNPNLVALNSAILGNTLSAAQQGALSQALTAIIPFFPSPDELGDGIPPTEEQLAREWIAALYSLAGGGGLPVATPIYITTPADTTLPVPFQPGTGGKILLVADVTPQFTGELLVSVQLTITESAAGVPAMLLTVIDNLTAITGGTPIAPGLTAEPTSTTPAPSAGTLVFGTQEASFTNGANTQAVPVLASIPVQAVVGHRTGIVIVAEDTSTQNWTSILASVSIVERVLA